MGDILTQTDFEAIVTRATGQLVSVRHKVDGSFVTTSAMYPSGGSVVVWLGREPPYFLVSDYGLSYQECAIMGADKRQFLRRAEPVAETSGVKLTADGAFEIRVSEAQLPGAIKAVSPCSQEDAIKIPPRLFQRQRADVGDLVFSKLERLYGERAVTKDYDFLGASQSHWHIDVAVVQDEQVALFDTVTPWAQSVAFTLAKFGDIRLLDSPPSRTAVLAAKSGYGSWMTALAQNGSILEAAANDDAYKRAAHLL